MSLNRGDSILVDYIALLRELMLYQNNMFMTFSRTTETLSSQLSRLIDNVESRQHINNNNINSTENNNLNNYFASQTNPLSRSTERPRSNIWTWPSTIQNDITSNRIPVSRRRNRQPWHNRRTNSTTGTTTTVDWFTTPTRVRNRARRRRNLVQQILNNSLYTSTTRNPASQTDISRNTSVHFWSDISNNTDQNICPITQDNFTNTDRVMRIDHCGHLFIQDALTTYLTEFDHRCPICRYNIRTEPTPPQNVVIDTSRNSPFDNMWDISFNFPNNNTFTNSTNIANNTFSFNDAINQISSAMATQLTNAMSNPDNSGNMISAEYSLFIPTALNSESNNTDTTD